MDGIGKLMAAAKAAADAAATVSQDDSSVIEKMGIQRRRKIKLVIKGPFRPVAPSSVVPSVRPVVPSVAPCDIGGRRTSSKDKYFTEPDLEPDFDHCERCTPSYCLLPNNYSIPVASQKTKIGSEVLNHECVSLNPSVDKSFKHAQKNQYEEILFRCEDDMFELDVLMGSAKFAARRVEKLLQEIDIDSGPFCVEDHFSVLNLRCMERLYGKHGLDFLDNLQKNPSLVLPVVLSRLKQKQREWLKCYAHYNKVWADTFLKNHNKSLDHSSLNFKGGPPLAPEGPAPAPEGRIWQTCRFCNFEHENLQAHMRDDYMVQVAGVDRYECRFCHVTGTMEEVFNHLLISHEEQN